ncbi:putative quinol monooxygenase [Devosia sp. A449]
MFGLMGRMLAPPGKREELLAIMLEGNAPMPGCRSYVIARDLVSAEGIWITEVWDSKDSHAASLKLPQVQATIAKARPLIAGFDQQIETEPLGGIGLMPS